MIAAGTIAENSTQTLERIVGTGITIRVSGVRADLGVPGAHFMRNQATTVNVAGH
jgi:hypothetical protein